MSFFSCESYEEFLDYYVNLKNISFRERLSYVLVIAFLLTQLIVRVCVSFSDDITHAFEWYNVSFIAFQTQIFNYLCANLYFFTCLMYRDNITCSWVEILRMTKYITERNFELGKKSFDQTKLVFYMLRKLCFTSHIVFLIGFTVIFYIYFGFFSDYYRFTGSMFAHSLVNNLLFNISLWLVMDQATKTSANMCLILLINQRIIKLINRLFTNRVTTFEKYWEQMVIFMRYFSILNKKLGAYFFSFLFTSSLIYAYSTVWFMSNHRLILRWKYAIVSACSLLFIMTTGVWAMHFAMCQFSTFIHAGSKGLFRCCVEPVGIGKCRIFVSKKRFRLAHIINAMHVRRKAKYGFSYGPFGVMTMLSFVKYIIVYCNIIRLTYNLQGSYVYQNH